MKHDWSPLRCDNSQWISGEKSNYEVQITLVQIKQMHISEALGVSRRKGGPIT